MKLTAFTIKKLWGDKNISIKLDKDVNIFSGINGSGKTTILNIIYSVLENNLQDEACCNKYESAQLLFTDDYQVDISTTNGQKIASYTYKNKIISQDEFLQQLNYACVASFDYSPYSADERRKLEEKYVWVKSELDYVLASAIHDYYMYVVRVNNQIRKAAEQKSTKVQQVFRYFQSMSEMQDIFDEIYAPSLKWDRDSDEVQFILMRYDNKRISPHDLSSGEKQMLILLISTLVQRKQECIVLWDEPELSMHVDWQKILIGIMRKINPNMQLIMATHSPFILFEGWENRAINLHSILKSNGKQG